jgi:hypothetical protein
MLKSIPFILSCFILVSSCGGASGDGSSTDGVEALEHRIFLTSESHNGKIVEVGGLEALEAADAICLRLAKAASLERKYKAILSTDSETAKDRLVITGAIYTVAGTEKTKIFQTSATLWDSDNTPLLNDINRDESGTLIIGSAPVWSGTQNNGGSDSNCLNWKSDLGTEDARVGVRGSQSDTWLDSSDNPCSNTYPFYCISQ